MPTPGLAANNPLYSIAFETGYGFIISRKDTQEILFSANAGPWIFSNQYLQLSARLPNTNLYGIGQHNDKFKRSFDWQLIPLFSSLLYPDYGSHPFYVMMENSHKSHGVFLFNSNAMDILLQPTPAITYRVTGGILDFYFLLGPTPNDVVQQYNELIGLPFMPPYWSLGFHLSRYGYNSDNATRANWQRNKDIGIPFDTQWNDIDYMNNFRDFTYDTVNYANIKSMVDEFHSNGYHYVVITDAGISQVEDGSYPSYNDGLLMDIFVKTAEGGFATGQVWPEISLFPDFTHPDIETYWTNQFARFHEDVPYDGAWIDMNEPTTFTAGSIYNVCTSTPYDNPPYQPAVEGGFLNARTICLSSVHAAGVHYDLHNLYAYTEINQTYKAIKSVLKKRPFVLTRSTAPGAGKYTAHWSGDIYSSWDDLRQSIPSLLNFNLYGFPMVGSDICGFRENTELELCQRWTQLGAFYPFSRNHNEDKNIDQDPASLGPAMVTVAKEALNLRYSFLPFFYTQLYRTHVYGENAIRPLFFEFPDDENTYSIQEQFIWGHHLMIIPVVQSGTNTADVYFPTGRWYFYPEGTFLDSTGTTTQITQPLDGTGLQVVLREGYIIPLQTPALTTTVSRNNGFSLLVTLNSNGEAEGELFWDDGDAIDSIELGYYTHIAFSAATNSISSSVNQFYILPPTGLENVTVYNVPNQPNSVILNDDTPLTFNYDNANKVLYITGLSVPLQISFVISWS
ncbi:hypothetical protein CHUAL_000350 [Chamberlinius hualienensis]